jgi:hypothetical protein
MEKEKENKEMPRICIRYDGRKEWICKHGVGHPYYVPKRLGMGGWTHGCCGCCRTSEEFARLIKGEKKLKESIERFQNENNSYSSILLFQMCKKNYGNIDSKT